MTPETPLPAAWLLKTEAGTFSFDDLVRERRTVWDGVTNPVALRNLRAMREGDPVVIYHTGKEKAAVGMARVVRAAYDDRRRGGSGLPVVDLEAGDPLPRAVPLAELKVAPAFSDSPLVRQGRLSVVPLTREQWGALQELAHGGGGGARPPASEERRGRG